MSAGLTRASTSRLLFGRHDLDHRLAGADRAAAGGDEDAVDPPGERRAQHRALRAGWRAPARRGGGRPSRPGRWRARWPAWARHSCCAWARLECASATPARARLTASPAPSISLCGDVGGAFGLDQAEPRLDAALDQRPDQPRLGAALPVGLAARLIGGLRLRRRCARPGSAGRCAAPRMPARSAMREACSACSIWIWSASDRIARQPDRPARGP